MSTAATTLRQLARIRSDNHALLDRFSDLTALGRKNFTAGTPSGAPCIIVYVPRRIPLSALPAAQRIPSVLRASDGVLHAYTDVVATENGRAQPPAALAPDNARLCQKLRWQTPQPWGPLQPGCQLAYGRPHGDRIAAWTGTLGCMVRDRDRPESIGFLTNHHIGEMPGQSFYRPRWQDGAQRIGRVRRTLRLIADERWIPGIDEPDAFSIIDASFATIAPGVIGHNRLQETPDGPATPLGAVLAIDYDSMDIIGKPVKKIGQRTGIQRGVIIAAGLSQPRYSQGVDRTIGHSPARYYADLYIAPRHPSVLVSAPGDSGALVLLDTDDADNNRPVALLWGGGSRDVGRGGIEQLSFATNLHRILEVMGLVMV